MMDRKVFPDKSQSIGLKRLDPEALGSVAGGVSCGLISIDEEEFNEMVGEYKEAGWTYEEVLKLVEHESKGATPEEMKFVHDYFNKAWYGK